MKFASVAEVKAQLSAYLKAISESPVVVTRNGKPVAVLLAVESEEDIESLILAHSPRFQAILDKARQRIREGAGIRREEFWQDVEKEKTGKGRSRVRGKSA